ncbi:MAG: sigma-70 family RNA polymerase sigma factor, partial [Verrucomicrobiales bacterium]|nr:sigma-70 family RNA polymerase sigma factor [Verrucomicrobiales bacterium]
MLSARDRDSPESDQALEQLCRAYWRPLYAYIRRRGHGPREAEDLTQGFFQVMLARHYLGDLTPGTGRFRSFLLTSLNHFLANEWDRTRTLKRGGKHVVVSLEELAAEGNHPFEPADEVTPEHLFDRLWASTLLDAVLARLQAEF